MHAEQTAAGPLQDDALLHAPAMDEQSAAVLQGRVHMLDGVQEHAGLPLTSISQPVCW